VFHATNRGGHGQNGFRFQRIVMENDGLCDDCFGAMHGARCANGENPLSLRRFDCAMLAIVSDRWRRDH
jgi:hypothetical protein